MRTLSIAAALTVVGLTMAATLANQQIANAMAQAQEFHQPSVSIGQQTADAQTPPVRSSHAF